MSGKQFNCVICNAPFLRETRWPVITCQNGECKYLNCRVTRMNANRKQRGLGCVACVAACPKSISIDVIALMHKDYRKAKFANRKDLARK